MFYKAIVSVSKGGRNLKLINRILKCTLPTYQNVVRLLSSMLFLEKPPIATEFCKILSAKA